MDWILGVHSLLRWIILLFLLINIFRNLVEADNEYTKADKSWNLRLLIVAHISLLIGLFQYFFGNKGFKLIQEQGGEVMKNAVSRFWAVEHIAGMIIAVVLITIANAVAKKDLPAAVKHRRQLRLYLVALIIILACIPWPFRPGFEDIPYIRTLK